MKKLSYLLLMLLLPAFIMVSCDNGSDDDDGDSTIVTTETISAKWNISGSNGYESFEFTKDGYYIVEAKSAVRSDGSEQFYFGTYTINGDVITMSGFGKLTVTTISDKVVSFILVLSNNLTEEVISAAKQSEIANSTNTALLCRTWELADERIPGLDGDYLYETDEIIIIFSRAGTYLVYNDDFEETNGVGLAQWKWTDSSQTAIYYTWTWDDWSDPGRVEIYELTSNRVVFVESFTHEPEDEISVFKPIGN